MLLFICLIFAFEQSESWTDKNVDVLLYLFTANGYLLVLIIIIFILPLFFKWCCKGNKRVSPVESLKSEDQESVKDTKHKFSQGFQTSREEREEGEGKEDYKENTSSRIIPLPEEDSINKLNRTFTMNMNPWKTQPKPLNWNLTK